MTMCGIAGSIDLHDNKKDIIKDMCDRIAHRGPDGKGYYTDDPNGEDYKLITDEPDMGITIVDPFVEDEYNIVFVPYPQDEMEEKICEFYKDDEYIKMLVNERDTASWFLEYNEKTDYYPYYIYTNKGYDDEIDFVGFYQVIGIKTKDEARELAKDYQFWASERSLSYGEIADLTELFTKLGKRFGLIREFRENGII